MTFHSPLRVVQWTTGNIARQAVRAVMDRSDLELVGCFAFSADKVGRDVGDLCGLGYDTGIVATDDVGALLATEPDCVLYTPLHPNIDELVGLLEAGVNVVTTSEILSGRTMGRANRNRIETAAQAGGATLFGTGMNPGWSQLLAAVAAGNSLGVGHVRVREAADVSLFVGDANFDEFGWGRPAGDPGHPADLERASRTFAEGADVLAALLGIDDPVLRFTPGFAHATVDLDLPGRPIAAGTVAGIDLRWEIMVEERAVAELHSRFVATRELIEGWSVEHGYRIEVDGDPQISITVGIMPTDLHNLTVDSMRDLGLRISALPAVNAIPGVCAAAPGLKTYADIPPPTARIS